MVVAYYCNKNKPKPRRGDRKFTDHIICRFYEALFNYTITLLPYCRPSGTCLRTAKINFYIFQHLFSYTFLNLPQCFFRVFGVAISVAETMSLLKDNLNMVLCNPYYHSMHNWQIPKQVRNDVLFKTSIFICSVPKKGQSLAQRKLCRVWHYCTYLPADLIIERATLFVLVATLKLLFVMSFQRINIKGIIFY